MTILVGEALVVLRSLAGGSVHCVVTSPPYWGLRDYGVEGQLGLEATPEAWSAGLVGVFREVRRVLRDDGVCFVNIGDSYCSGTTAERRPGNGDCASWTTRNQGPRTAATGDLKPKDLVGQPWLLAFGLRADGWWLRSEIIWAKPNPMPESVWDRPAKAHETVFLLSKSAKYFWDSAAVREGVTGNAHARGNGVNPKTAGALSGTRQNASFSGGVNELVSSRNLRSVWTIATEAFPEAHFATYPQELVRRCILAGTSAKGCCPGCGAPWGRVVERIYKSPLIVGDNPQVPDTFKGDKSRPRARNDAGQFLARGADARAPATTRDQIKRMGDGVDVQTLGWGPSCACDAGEPVPCTILDPFGGSGTTGLVAEQLGREALLIELSPEYAAMAERRLAAARSRRALGQVEKVPVLPGQLGLFG